jgi:ferrous iron transport protein A
VSKSVITLGEFAKGMRGIIRRTGGPLEMRNRLLEMGFLEGSVVELVHVAPFGGDPIAVKIRGSLLALRRSEANFIEMGEVQAAGEKP